MVPALVTDMFYNIGVDIKVLTKTQKVIFLIFLFWLDYNRLDARETVYHTSTQEFCIL